MIIISRNKSRKCREFVVFYIDRQGFTLLEVIVALVLFASVGMAVFSWINTSLISVERINRINKASEMVVNGTELLRTLNPITQPEGELATDSFHLSWKVSEYLAPVDQKYGVYNIAVYTVSAVIRPTNSDEGFEFSFLQHGYQPQVNP